MYGTFSNCYLHALQTAQVSFYKIAHMNIEKACGRFIDPDPSTLPAFDSDFPDAEKLPLHFEIKINQRNKGRSYLQWNDVFIGDPLTDNIIQSDGYRFHDVFHFAHALWDFGEPQNPTTTWRSPSRFEKSSAQCC